jgi:hypothetical protein
MNRENGRQMDWHTLFRASILAIVLGYVKGRQIDWLRGRMRGRYAG